MDRGGVSKNFLVMHISRIHHSIAFINTEICTDF